VDIKLWGVFMKFEVKQIRKLTRILNDIKIDIETVKIQSNKTFYSDIDYHYDRETKLKHFGIKISDSDDKIWLIFTNEEMTDVISIYTKEGVKFFDTIKSAKDYCTKYLIDSI